jgi:hypothetical protein
MTKTKCPLIRLEGGLAGEFCLGECDTTGCVAFIPIEKPDDENYIGWCKYFHSDIVWW